MRIEELLGLPFPSSDPLFSLLPVRTTYQDELLAMAAQALKTQPARLVKQHSKNAGLKDWGGMQKGDRQLHEADLEIMRAKQFIDPKVHVVHDSNEKLPKYFQIGTLEPSCLLDRSRKQRAGRLADHYIAEDQHLGYTRRKTEEINTRKRRIKKVRH